MKLHVARQQLNWTGHNVIDDVVCEHGSESRD